MGTSSSCEVTIFTPHGIKNFIVVFNILSMLNTLGEHFCTFKCFTNFLEMSFFSSSLSTMFSQCCTIFWAIFVHFDLNFSTCILDLGTLLRRATIGGSCVELRSSLDSSFCKFALFLLCLYMVGLPLIKESHITSE